MRTAPLLLLVTLGIACGGSSTGPSDLLDASEIGRAHV